MSETIGERDVVIYAWGLVVCSVCAPADMPLHEVERKVNLENPTGISSRWSLAEDKVFANGMPNPSPCNDDPARLHYLMSC